MTVAQILKDKGTAVTTMQAGQTVCEAAALLRRERIGAVVVVDARHAVAGVFSERDVVRALSEAGHEALDRPIRDFMSVDVVTCRMSDTIDMLMSSMTGRRIRHLPVVEEGRLCGIVSIGDVVKRRIADAEAEASMLKQYVAGGM